jgi:hypothetical protein
LKAARRNIYHRSPSFERDNLASSPTAITITPKTQRSSEASKVSKLFGKFRNHRPAPPSPIITVSV